MMMGLLGIDGVAGGGGVTYATFDGVNSNATITNAGLTATHNSSVQGGARSATTKNSGLFYFELTITDIAGAGLLTAAGTYNDLVLNGTNGAFIYSSNGNIWSNNANSGKTLGALSNGDIIGIAVDFTHQKIWFRKAPSGNWNGLAIGSENPATNTGGVSISSYSATTLGPATGWANSAGGATTANFGGSSFSGTLPSGFTSGWPV